MPNCFLLLRTAAIRASVPVVSMVLLFSGLATAQYSGAKELQDAVAKDRDKYERALADLDRSVVTSASLAIANEIVTFRERWWHPGGIAESSSARGVAPPGSLRNAYELRARIKLRLNDHEGALNDLALKLTAPDPVEGPLEAAEFAPLFEHIESHKTIVGRMADIDHVIKRAPNLGLLFLQRAKYHEPYSAAAIADVERAISLSPKEADAYEFAADIYFQLGEVEKALVVLDKATTNLPLNFRFHRLRASALRGDLETGDLRAGVKRLTAVIDSCNCARVRLYYYLRERAAAFLELKEYDAVIADSTRVIDISEAVGGKPAGLEDPDDWSYNTLPYVYRSIALVAKGNYAEALPDLDLLVERNGFAHDYANRALARCKTGDLTGAKQDEEKAIRDGATIEQPCGSKPLKP